jgi:hypothetical protein
MVTSEPVDGVVELVELVEPAVGNAAVPAPMPPVEAAAVIQR